jgi:hypothetical protein
MNRWTKTSLVLVMVTVFAFTPVLVSAATNYSGGTEGNPDGNDIVADLFLLRPVGIVATIFGSACFVLSLPISAPTQTSGTTWKKLVADPAKFTFARPMGHIEY